MNKAQKALKIKRNEFIDQLTGNKIEFENRLSKLSKVKSDEFLEYTFRYADKPIFTIIQSNKTGSIAEIDLVTDRWIRENKSILDKSSAANMLYIEALRKTGTSKESVMH